MCTLDEVKAVVGGRNYGTSQLNHALATRQPGSVFKPFVYAAALSEQNRRGIFIYTFEHGGRRADDFSFREYGVRAG